MGLDLREPAHAPLRWQVGAALGVAAFVVAAATVVISWALVHTLFAMRYARLFHEGGGRHRLPQR